MLVLQQTTIQHSELTLKHGLREMLPPRTCLAQQLGKLETEAICRQSAITIVSRRTQFFGGLQLECVFKGLAKQIEMFACQTQTRRHGMTTKLGKQARL